MQAAATKPAKKATVIDKAPVASINASTFFTPKAIQAASELDEKMVMEALKDMFEDAFLYGYKALDENEILYSFNDRENILTVYNGFNQIIPILCKYHWFATQEPTVTEADYQVIYWFMESIMDMREALPVLEAMMITTILYKYVRTGDRPADYQRPGNIYLSFTLLRALIMGYILTDERSDA